jgi:hypothetical protein
MDTQRNLQPVCEELGVGPIPEGEKPFAQHMRSRIPGNREEIHIPRAKASCLKATPNGLTGETGPMLHALEPLLLRSAHQLSIAKESRGGIPMVSVDP